METQIRLVDRQGLLQGVQVTEVQSFANFLLINLETIAADRAADVQTRRDVANLGLERFAQLFPEYVPDGGFVNSTQEVRDDNPDTAYDYGQGAVRYEAATDEMTEEKMMELMNQLMAEASSGNVFDDGTGGWI